MNFPGHDCELVEPSFSEAVTSNLTLYHQKVGRFSQWFRMQTTISPTVPNTIYRSYKAHIKTARVQLSQKYWYMIHPFSNFRWHWNQIMSVVYIVAYFNIPLQIINRQMSHTNIIQILVDLLCLTDIVMNFHTGFVYEETNQVIIHRGLVAKRYFGTYFFVDLLSSIPTLATEYTASYDMFYIDVLKILKVFRIKTLSNYLNSTIMKTRLVYNYTFVTFSKLAVQAIFMLHWLSCALIIVPLIQVHYNEQYIATWMGDEVIKQAEEGNIIQLYLNCFRITLAMIIGDLSSVSPVMTSDVILCIMTIIIGYVYFAYVLVMVINYVLTINSATVTYQETMNQLQTYMHLNHMPERMQSKITTYYEYKYNYRYFPEHNIMYMLPQHLKAEVSLHACQKLLESVELFHNLPKEVLSAITINMEPMIFLPNDVLVRAGSQGTCMYFLVSGTVTIISPNGKEVCHLQDGSYFGEVALLKRDNRRVASVIAIEFCEVYRLSAHDFRNSVLSHIALADKLRMGALDRQDFTSTVDRMRTNMV
ncbi:potassium/sodium hyperpolarization-activated cyclic nucleotide-gated channel 1-like [Ctenocephalides felis]|uniref:potassium/sodium hyperpolarization-activated cyclic nucleotide-gated channel 1-like n=1 Tax=Ctenocephalides felis TaxID=7515 RepID=UPI000E6E4E78|nr:potassium/sodium hyperpolarization-activated cyclic nucleotide-gated channel 1-like [Ctenocephalides felis]